METNGSVGYKCSNEEKPDTVVDIETSSDSMPNVVLNRNPSVTDRKIPNEKAKISTSDSKSGFVNKGMFSDNSTISLPRNANMDKSNGSKYQNNQIQTTDSLKSEDSSDAVKIDKLSNDGINEIPVPPRTSSKLLNLPKVSNQNTALNISGVNVLEPRSTGTSISKGSSNSKNSPQNETANTKSIPAVRPRKKDLITPSLSQTDEGNNLERLVDVGLTSRETDFKLPPRNLTVFKSPSMSEIIKAEEATSENRIDQTSKTSTFPMTSSNPSLIPETMSLSRPKSNTSLTASKASLDRMLKNIQTSDSLPNPAGLAKFPQNSSCASLLHKTAATSLAFAGVTQVDGIGGSSFSTKSRKRNRAQERMNEALLSAIYYSQPIEELRKLLEKGADISTKCRDSGASVLHVAALNADPATADFLISEGADVKARDRAGKQPIHVAAWEGALDVIKALYKVDNEVIKSKVEEERPFHNECPDSWNHKHDQINKYWHVMEAITAGSTPLHVACRRTKELCVKFLIEVGADALEEDSKGLYPVDVIGVDVGEDAINRAESDSSEGSTVGIARLLIKHQKRLSSQLAVKGAPDKGGTEKGWLKVRRLLSVDYHDVRPVTALHTAVSDNNLNLMTILLDEGADVLVWNEGGETPLHLAVKKKFLDALCLMLRHGDNRGRRVVDAVDTRDRSLLHVAVAEEWTDGISILLEENVDVTCKNDRRQTVLHSVAESGNVKILTELLTVSNVSLIINGVDIDCYAPVHNAVENNHLKCLELLVDKGANVDILLPDGRTLLHIVAKNNSETLMDYLMSCPRMSSLKENKITTNEGGMTALHVASSLGHNNVVEMLLRYGCDLGAKTNDNVGSTSLHLAAKYDRVEVITTILEFDNMGTSLESKDNHGWYPLHIAAGHGHEECVNVLLRAGADIALPVQDEQGTKFTGLDIIMTCVHRPVDFLVKILDSYIIVDNKVPVTNPQCKIEVDFDFILPSPPESKQLGVLEAVLNNGSEDLEEAFFLHPIVQTFIHLKSKNMFLFFALFFDLFFLLAFYLSVIAYHGSFTLKQPLQRYILIGLLSINILFEVINVVRLQRYYLKDPETWIKWCVYSNIMIIVIHPHDLVLRYNMAISILLSWTELLLIIAKYPAWGIYVLMFATVAGTILKVLAVFSLLLVGFAFTFRALFQEKGPFNSVWSSLVKVIIMVYELDYRGTMEESSDEGQVFADVARLFYLLFVLMVSLSLVNLMLGLAISDIADLKRKGRAKRLAKQVAFLGSLENLLYSWPLESLALFRKYRKAPHSLVVKAGSKLSGAGEDSPVPRKLKEFIIDKARSVQQINQSMNCSTPVQMSTLDYKVKDDTSSIGTKRSLSVSRNRVYMDK